VEGRGPGLADRLCCRGSPELLHRGRMLLPHQPEEIGYDPYSMPEEFRRDDSPDSLYSTKRFNAMSSFQANEVIRLETKNILSELDDLLATAATASSFWPGSCASMSLTTESMQLKIRGAEYLMEVEDLIAQTDDMFADRFAISPVDDLLVQAERVLDEAPPGNVQPRLEERWKPAALDMKLIVGDACRRSKPEATQQVRGGPLCTHKEAGQLKPHSSEASHKIGQGSIIMHRSRPPALDMHVIIGEPPSPSPGARRSRTGSRGGGRWRTFAAVAFSEAKTKIAPLICQTKKASWSWAPWSRLTVMA